MPIPFGLQNGRPLVAFCFHLTCHRIHQIARWRDIFDLNTRHLNAPRVGCFIDHGKKFRIDLIALAQEFIQIHAAHHGACIGHGEVENGVFKIIDLISGFRSVHHLIENNTIGRNHGVVAGNNLLAWHIQHLLLLIHLGANHFDKGRDNR